MPTSTKSRQNKWDTYVGTDDSPRGGAKTKFVVKAKVSSEPPNDVEKAKVQEIIKSCEREISSLKFPTDDVVGEWRILRFLRNHEGNVDKAVKKLKMALERRTRNDHLIEDMGQEVKGLSPDEFVAWFKERSNPYIPICPYGGENSDGSVVYFFARQGGADFKSFANERNDQQPISDEVFLIYQSNEWLMWYLNEKCKKLNRMCYVRKFMDLGGLSTNPFMVAPVKTLVLTGLKAMGIDYCDGDDRYVLLNTPVIFDILFPIVKLFYTKRQRNKFHSINMTEINKHCEVVPKGQGGPSETVVDDFLYKPRESEAVKKHLSKRIELRKMWLGRIPVTGKEIERFFK